jgi:phospholipid-binding lipoprotein MlaA
MKILSILITAMPLFFFVPVHSLAFSSPAEQGLISSAVKEEKALSPEQLPALNEKNTEQKASEKEEIIEDEGEEETVKIADPLSPWNKAMYHVNDKVYFWLLKPVSQEYSRVVPEDIRLSVSNVFQNLTSPIRFVSSLLQLKMRDAGNELLRFVYNSTAGIGGLADVARTDLRINRKEEDIGQAIGHYGIGHGFYIVWPFLGPSSLRDTVGRVGDMFLDPVSYVNPVEAAAGITVYDKVNETSFHIGDYEDLKKSAVDPYISIRDAYVQYRNKKVRE